MKYMIDKKLIFPNVSFETQEEALQFIGAKLIQNEYVEQSFIKEIIARERKYPTGLNVSGEIKVAIPHCDACNVRKPTIAFASLNQPVKFGNMESPDESLDVDMIFLLAIKDPEEQIGMLQRLMQLFQTPSSLKVLRKMKDADAIKTYLEKDIIERMR